MKLTVNDTYKKMAIQYWEQGYNENILKRIIITVKCLMGRYVYIPYVEIPITLFCTLKCQNCSNLIPEYNNKYHLTMDVYRQEVSRLLQSVNEIGKLRILGGEPLLHPQCSDVLNYLQNKKVIREIHVVTNGTIIPSSEIIKSMKKANVHVFISNYGQYSSKIRELKKLLSKNNIKVISSPRDAWWYDFGEFKFKNRNNYELKKQFSNCFIPCKSLINGKLHYCSRSAHGLDCGKITEKECEFIDLLKKGQTVQNLRNEIVLLYYGNKGYISTCQYCNIGTRDVKKIKAGVQLP